MDFITGPRQHPRPDLHWKIQRARIVLAVERAWPLCWPALSWVGLFLALSLFDLWRNVPNWVHIIALAVFGVMVFRTYFIFLRRFVAPTHQEALQRIEADSGLSDHVLSSLEDTPVDPANKTSLALWEAYQQRIIQTLGRLNVRWPRLSLTDFDPKALRVLSMILLITGFMIAGDQSCERIKAAFAPHLGGAPEHIDMEAWITPPEYTGLPPVLISRVNDDGITVLKAPQGSIFTAKLNGGWRTPWIKTEAGKQSFHKSPQGNYEIETELQPTHGLTIGQGGKVHHDWPLQVKADTPPIVVFNDLPSETTTKALKISYQVFDDFGVESLSLNLQGPKTILGDHENIALTPPVLRGDEPVSTATYQDLTASPWAGDEIQMMLIATDALGQVGQALPTSVTLPERIFTHPLAKELIAIRKQLFHQPQIKERLSRYLDMLAKAPEHYGGDLSAFAALRVAHWRLIHDDQLPAIKDVTDILWDLALYLEEGVLSRTQEALRQKMDALMSALQNGDNASLRQLMEELRRKMTDMLQAQLDQLQKQDADANNQNPPNSNAQSRFIDAPTLERMMQQIEDLAASGDMQAAMEMLAELQNIMENLQFADGPSQQDMERALAADQAMQGLENLSEMQQGLMNETIRESLSQARQDANGQQRSEQPGQQNPSSGDMLSSSNWSNLAQAQKDLQEGLDTIEGSLGEAGIPSPSALEDARRAMEQAGQNLRRGDGIPSVQAQGEAIENLQSAQQSLNQALQEAMQQIQQSGQSTDPLGRANAGQRNNGDIKIPTESDIEATRAIVQELQRRLSNPALPAQERAYIRRLLERF